MDNKRRIIIYHSYSGHTKMIANIIKKKIDCDVLELEPKYEFSSDYDEVVKVTGMDIVFVTTAKTNEEALHLLNAFGLPFRK